MNDFNHQQSTIFVSSNQEPMSAEPLFWMLAPTHGSVFFSSAVPNSPERHLKATGNDRIYYIPILVREHYPRIDLSHVY